MRKSAQIIAINDDRSLPHEQSVSQQIALGKKFTAEELSPAALRGYSTQSLKLILRAVDNVSFYTQGSQPFLSMQERVFEELAKRKDTLPADVQDLFKRYLAARLFEKARALKGRFPSAELWDIPDIVDSGKSSALSHRVFDISNDARTATIMHLPVDVGSKIVIATFSSCPVTARALKAIESDKSLSKALQSNGLLLTNRFEPGGVAYFNSKAIGPRTYVAYTASDWPNIDFSSSPSFYFIKDGKIAHHFSYWDSNGDALQDFKIGLESIGLAEK